MDLLVELDRKGMNPKEVQDAIDLEKNILFRFDLEEISDKELKITLLKYRGMSDIDAVTLQCANVKTKMQEFFFGVKGNRAHDQLDNILDMLTRGKNTVYGDLTKEWIMGTTHHTLIVSHQGRILVKVNKQKQSGKFPIVNS